MKPSWFVCLCLMAPHLGDAAESNEAQAARDLAIVQSLLRLKSVDVNSRPKLKEAALRHLESKRGTEEYVDLVAQLGLRGVEGELLRIALADPNGTAGVQAAGLILERDQQQLFQAALGPDDPERSLQAVQVLTRVGSLPVMELLKPLITDTAYSRAVRSTATSGLGRNRHGQQFLLELIIAQELPQELKFAAANALYASRDESIRSEVAKYLQLPATADSKPLPPIDTLVKRQGDVNRGEQLFRGTATCHKCHQVGDQGKEVGPNLSEIGSKLSREAMFVSILDPSAGISHNYESYTAILVNGSVVSGILVDRTDSAVTLRTAEAIDVNFAADQIEEMQKSHVSLMPADIQKTLSEQDLVDVVEYMTSLKKPD